jgi:hypothetical protein
VFMVIAPLLMGARGANPSDDTTLT